MLEQLHAILVVGFLLELQIATISHELVEFLRLALAEVFEGHLELFLLDIQVLLILVFARQTLPRE